MLILADDLTGAADCGLACTTVGLDTLVLLDVRDIVGGAEALAVDLDSRGLPAPDARAVTRLAAGRLLVPGTLLYKKIDSTLRGNPAAEIAAAHEAVAAGPHGHGGVLALVAPAFPATGRTTRGGRVLVHGVELELTGTWTREGRGADPDLTAMLAAAGLPSQTVPLGPTRNGGLPGLLRKAAADGVGALVCDAETDADLACIAAAGRTLGPAVVWAGSAGLARHLGALAAPGAGDQHGRPTSVAATRRPGPVVAVVGSMSAVTPAQVAALARLPRCAAVAVIPGTLLAGPASPQWQAAGRSLDAALGAAGDGGVVALSIGAGLAGDAPDRLLCAALARLAAPHVGHFGALAVTGGETARAVLGLAGASGLRLVGEIEPGAPLGMALGLPGAPLPVVTKAGAFGDEFTLVRCAEALRALPLDTGA